MDSEDDICILPHSDDDVDIDAEFNPVIPFSPFSPSPACDVDRASHFALKKAYLTLKQKLNKTSIQNQLLVQRVQELESSKSRELDSFINIGESFDMMEDARYMPEGGASTQVTNESYANVRRRQLTPVQASEKTIPEKTYAASVSSGAGAGANAWSQQVALLKQEQSRLLQSLEGERKEKEAVIQLLQEQREKCTNLQLERDKALNEGAMLQASLEKANQELAILRDRPGEGMSAEPPAELLSELANMRRVIDKLKRMVLMQKDCLVSQNLSMSTQQRSLSRSPRDLPSMESNSSPQGSSSCGGGSGGSPSGQSWELVNGTATAAPLPADMRPQPQQQQLLQQRSGKVTTMGATNLSPRRDGVTNASTAGHPGVSGGGTAGKAGNQTGWVSGSQNGQALNNQNGPALNNQSGPRQVQTAPRSRTEMIHRRHSEENVQQPKGAAEAPRAHTLPQQTPRGLADWMNNHNQQQGGRGGGGGPYPQPALVGLNQFMRDAPNPTPPPGIVESGQRVGSGSSPSRPVKYPPSAAPLPPQRQMSPVSQPASVYENVPYSSATSATTTGPSMHILNQSSMTGARVLQTNSGSFRSGGMSASPTPAANPQPVVSVGVSRDGTAGVSRGSPQEHGDTSRPRNPTDLELNMDVHFANAPAGNQSGNNMDRKCPVCGQDFSHITMDEFQNHVFECFDDVEDPAYAPETLQPQPQVGGSRQGQGQRSFCKVCPMCEKSFADTVTQDFFESHVQSHFDDVVDHFEMLDAHRT